jgi:predicted kinase
VTLPLLVIVSGAPGSGKSTLARRLAPALGLPLLMRDEFKETLFDTITSNSSFPAARSAELGRAAYALLYAMTRRLLQADVGAILESNFYRGLAEPELTPLLAQTRAVQIHCGGDANVIVRRYEQRAARGERHAGHQDLAVIPRLREYLATGRCDPLDLTIPSLRVDTTAAQTIQYLPAFDAILAFVTESTCSVPRRARNRTLHR